ncbi:calcium-responsive transcription factor-like isoform X1 [Mytilus edulis]|uniref:calcium-responsive transcription factor-like isoform X1 n=1 Tax=Mytilus edulis TaxID=6550 RepID=UPI0039EF5D1E
MLIHFVTHTMYIVFYLNRNSTGGFVSSEKAVKDLIVEFELKTSSKFIVFKKDNLFGKENGLDLQNITSDVRWRDTQKDAVPLIPYDRIPFFILGKKKWDCHQGRQRNKSSIERNRKRLEETGDHDFKKRRKQIQITKKKNCPVQIRVRHIVKFPYFKIDKENEEDKHERDRLSNKLKECIKNQQEVQMCHQYHVYLPNEDHTNHFIGEAACLIQPVDEGVKKFIQGMVFEQNIHSTRQMKLMVEMYVRQMFQNSTLPQKTNKRFWPSSKDVQNHIVFALMRQRNSTVDQVVVKELVNKWENENSDDKFHLRLKEDLDTEPDLNG